MWPQTLAHLAVLLGAAALLVAAAFSDAHRYRIPNLICAALLVLFPLFVVTAPGGVEWQQNIMVFGLILASGIVMFFTNLVGAGDVKLLAATGLWAGSHFIALFLVVTALAGGVVALAMVALNLYRNHFLKRNVPLARVPIPYGVAISVGGLVVLYHLSEPIFFAS